MDKFAQIIPIKKLPRGMNFFDYKVPESLARDIKPGVLVKVPFKKGQIDGIVYAIKSETGFAEVKEIAGVISDAAIVPPERLKLLVWFAEYYYYSFGSTAELFFPHRPKRRAAHSVKKIYLAPEPPADRPLLKLARRLVGDKNDKYLLFPYDQKKKKTLFVQLAIEATRAGRQILFMFPQLDAVRAFAESLPVELSSLTAIWTVETKRAKTRRFADWLAIQNKEKLIIIGTRSTVFAPIENAIIVIDNSHSDDYKQWDQNPRYDARMVARQIQTLSGGKIIFSSVCPPIEDASVARDEGYQSVTLPLAKKTTVEIVDIKQNKDAGMPYVSVALIDALRGLERTDKRALIIVGKKGEYGNLVCRDCDRQMLCPDCELPLVVTKDKLACFRCDKTFALPLVCPQCHGANLRRFGVGIEQVENQLRQLTTAEMIFSTGQGLGNDDFENIGLLTFAYVDGPLFLSDFNAGYRSRAFVLERICRAAEQNHDWRIILQTAFPANDAFQDLTGSYGDFFQVENDARRNFWYPPHAALLKLFFEHHDEKICVTEADRLFSLLTNSVVEAGGRILPPYWHYTKRVRGRCRRQIAVFLPKTNIAREREIISAVPSHWVIDKDPISLL